MLLDVVNILVVMEVCALCLTLWNYGTCCISSHLNYYKLIQYCQNSNIILSRFLKWRPGTVASFNVFLILFITFYCTQYCFVCLINNLLLFKHFMSCVQTARRFFLFLGVIQWYCPYFC
jgi:hypothetical protein